VQSFDPLVHKIVSAAELTDFHAEHVAAYKIPARIDFRDHLPFTASGKIAHGNSRSPRD
jgi:acyl-CoA synthetase (AMP-forming)/AMP-acid ligase II